MAEYEQSIVVNAPADDVFNFVSNLNNLPSYLPTLRHARAAGPDRLHVQGAAGGEGYEAGGYFRVDPAEYFMEWSADTERNYSGWLEVSDLDNACEVTVHLSFRPNPEIEERMREHAGSVDQAMESGLQTALESIKSLCEQPRAAVA